MKKLLTASVAAILLTCFVPVAKASTIIYHDNFDGSSGSTFLNGSAPDVDNNGGSNTWSAFGSATNVNGYKEDGTLASGSVSSGCLVAVYARVRKYLHVVGQSYGTSVRRARIRLGTLWDLRKVCLPIRRRGRIVSWKGTPSAEPGCCFAPPPLKALPSISFNGVMPRPGLGQPELRSPGRPARRRMAAM